VIELRGIEAFAYFHRDRRVVALGTNRQEISEEVARASGRQWRIGAMP
jgi:hypothetical protein